MTPSDPDISLPGIPLRELEERWKLSRNGLKARARALGVELQRVSSTLTVWPGEYVDLGNQLDAHLKAGQPMGTFPGLAPASGSAISKTPPTPPPALANAAVADVLKAFFVPGSVGANADPLKRAKGLAEAADHALVLTTDELEALGVKGVTGFADGDLAYGYCFCKHHQRGRVLWTVERTIAKPAATDGTVTALPAEKRQVGFGAAVEARCEVLSAKVELPRLFAG